jgi:mannose-6-phosphate isomerase
VADGPWAERSLRDLMESERTALLGPSAQRHTVFPWLIKHLDACDWLSIQVHPDDRWVRTLCPGEGGKTEAWFILDVAPEGRVYAGLQPGVDEPRLRRALADGTVLEFLHGFQPRPGDCLFLPAGTVHAVGGGVLLAEIQQTSDATFRLYDWGRVDAQGRSRPLHIEQALACTDWTRGPIEPIAATGFPQPGRVAPAGSVCQPLVRCPYFELEYVRSTEPVLLGGTGRLQALIVVHGRGVLGDRPLVTADTVLLPAEMAETPCRPDGTLGFLRATLPVG